ncbi:DHA2 family efflux MFS transporter permease subunit [Stappia indica]|uniref:Drug resistance transporter, EmrB/QacA subfamily n=1 Tax=Stappia indica TaxID=538381 RepID=A0A285R7K9_9HYPH|nr:DHA2 family efflux MFS transporter permease subunit [Stappia indica]SOB89864.1 drug resistance transporter, EmrB/QacA subfamily [Stappia indica]
MNSIPLIIAFAFFMEMMDSTVIATSLPVIAEDLGTSPIALKLALTSYLVALGIFIPVSGWVADKFGAKRVFRWAIVVFVIGSVACAFSNSLLTFVLSRFLQGMGGSMMVPVGRLILVRTFQKKDLVHAMTLMTIPGLIGPMAGPPLGGFLTTYLSWHWIFIINVPIGFAGIWLCGIYLPEIPRRETSKLDWTGFLLTGTAAAGIVFGLSVISLPALPPAVGLATTIIGFAALLAYLVHARRRANPILDPALLRNRAFGLTLLGTNIFRISSGSMPFLMPLMLQTSFGYNAFQSGLITFTGAFGAISMKFIVKRALAAVGFRMALVIASLGGALLSFAMVGFVPGTPVWIFVLVLYGAGLTRSFLFTSSNGLAFTSIEENEASQATALSSVFQQVSLALGVALAGFVLEATGWVTGDTLGLVNFHIAFAVTAVLALVSVPIFAFLPASAGQEASGHRLRDLP